MMADANEPTTFIEDLTIEPTAHDNKDTTQTHTQHKHTYEGGLGARP
jgi:hypothetical protein